MTAPAIELVGIDKRFGAVHANRDIHLVVEKGTIHGIVGENGAGKSTLMSILYGFYQADAGKILIDGREVSIPDSKAALAHGIGMVHQHFMLVETFTVLENVVLGAEGGALIGPALGRARAELARLSDAYGLKVNPDALVSTLSVGELQRVEILKALYRGAEILILDEPTGVLTPPEADELFGILRVLRGQGKTVLLITHKLREIKSVTDAVSVMRQGAMVATRTTAEVSVEELASLMVGRSVLLRVDKGPAKPGRTVLAVEGLTVIDRRGVLRVKDVSFSVRAGEIVGIAGVSGNGQSELIEAIAGLARPTLGRVLIDGAPAAGTPEKVRRQGLAHVPEDRHRMGLVIPFEAAENAILGYHDDPSLGPGPMLSPDKVRAHAKGGLRRLRRPPARRAAEDGELLRRQPAEDRARPRDRARPGGARRRPADARRRHRRDRVHPPPPRRAARRRQGHPARLRRARRNPRFVRPHPGDVRRQADGRMRHRRPRGRARPADGRLPAGGGAVRGQRTHSSARWEAPYSSQLLEALKPSPLAGEGREGGRRESGVEGNRIAAAIPSVPLRHPPCGADSMANATWHQRPPPLPALPREGGGFASACVAVLPVLWIIP